MSNIRAQEIRVRIAPSPTGNLHVGTARTALFNFMFARRHGGAFILRIEDTDIERSKEEYVQNIYEGLRLLGLDWDEGPDVGGDYGPYKQSERLEIYREWVQKLLDAGKAYPCYCTEAELNAERERAKAENRPYKYSGRCRDAAAREALSRDAGRKSVVRFQVPGDRGDIVINDHVRGDVTFDAATLGDFVIVKSDGMPTYTLSNVVDDTLMRISHVIRGEDLLPNTPNQILLYEAFGVKPPEFAHLSLILSPDRTKLSKRHGATSIAEFIERGYLPEALTNFLTLLGWSSPTGDEEGSLAHFTGQFSLDRISNSPAVFDRERLDYLNGKTIRTMDLDDLLTRARPFLGQYDLHQYGADKLKMMLDIVREPVTTLSELPEAVIYFFGQKVILDAQFVGEVLTGEEQSQVLERFKSEFIPGVNWDDPEAIAASLKEFTEAAKPIKTKTVMWTIRGAVTGRTRGADLSKTLYILGRDIVANRIDTAIDLTVVRS